MAIPESLVSSVANRRIIPFVGSGVSMAVQPGLFPSWAGLIGRLAEKLKAEGDEDSAEIVELYLKKKQMNKAAEEAVESLGKPNFRDVMKDIFDIAQPDDVDLSLPNALLSLLPQLIVTTNYDHVLQWCHRSQVVTNSAKSNLADLFSTPNRDAPFVWHVHGHISEPDNLILSPSQYNALYRDAADAQHPLAAARQQLSHLFLNHRLLFVGFGLQDEFVMDALASLLDTFGGNLRPSYALLKKGDDRAAELWQKYSISVVEYADHGQPLVDVITNLAELAKAPTPTSGDQTNIPLHIPTSYVTWLTELCDDITPFGMAPAQGQSVSLQQVYVPPVVSVRETKDSKQELIENVETEASRNASPHLLLKQLEETSLYVSGDPGTGKSTFCRWLAWLTARGNVPGFEVASPDGFQEQFPESLQDRLPVLVPLREFVEYIPRELRRRRLSTAEFETALKNWVESLHPGGLQWVDVQAHQSAGRLLLILDGVDELPLTDGEEAAAWSPREYVLNGLTASATEWIEQGNRLLLTSRPYGVDSDRIRQLSRVGLPEARIEPLPEELQTLLATRWFAALPATFRQGPEVANEMLKQVRQMSQDVAALTGNPLLLTAVCIIYGEGKELPKDIHDLYHRIVNTSLHSRYSRDRRLIDVVRARLAAVAYGMHTGEPHDDQRRVPAPEVSYEELDQILAAYIGANRETESGFRDQVEAREDLLSRSGLLSQATSERASFFHLSFQEFLAAEQLARQHEGTDKLSEVFRQRAEFPGWRPTLKFLFARRVTLAGTRAAVDLLERLLGFVELQDIAVHQGLAVVVVDALENLRERDLNLQQTILNRFEQVCLNAMDQQVDLKPRVELFRMLGRIGDPRIATDWSQENAWCTVPAETYFYGDVKEPYEIEQEFQISKYPLTNGQFAEFVDQGYSDESFWNPVGWEWRVKQNVRWPRYWLDKKWNVPSQPVVGVSWWEADAYCCWAGLRMPTEQEWEAAARGPIGLVYPWADEWREGACNSGECDLGVTTPVGIFSGSASHCGAEDMAGNVWEWCNSHSSAGAENDANAGRVLRGGSWLNQADVCRSSIRLVNRPVFRDSLIGFRVART